MTDFLEKAVLVVGVIVGGAVITVLAVAITVTPYIIVIYFIFWCLKSFGLL